MSRSVNNVELKITMLDSSEQHKFYISQRSVETLLIWSGKYFYCFVADLFEIITGTKFYWSTFIDDITKNNFGWFLPRDAYK